MASIRPRKDRDGNLTGWQVQIQKRGFPSQTRTFRTKAEAQSWAAVIESEMARGVWQDRSEIESTLLDEALERYAREILPGKKGRTSEMSLLKQWRNRPVAKMFLASIRGKDIAEAIRDMQEEGKGANTVRLHLALLSHLFNVARREWGMEALGNPVELVRRPKLPRGRDRRLLEGEESRLLEACRSTSAELAAIVSFAIETAMRQGEILGMEWSGVDLKRQTVTLEETKNGEKRVVPLSDRAVEILKELPRRLDGRVWSYRLEGVRTSFPRAVKKAGIVGLTFHDLRHEATSRLFEMGFNPMQAAAITGHRNMQMLKRYTHIRPEDLVERLRQRP